MFLNIVFLLFMKTKNLISVGEKKSLKVLKGAAGYPVLDVFVIADWIE